MLISMVLQGFQGIKNYSYFNQHTELPQYCRRLNILREYDNENTTLHDTPEVKERTVRMLIEASGDHPSTWSAIQAIASKTGCTPETLRSWHKKHIDQTIPASVQAHSQEQRIKELERENKELKQANEVYVRLLLFSPRRRRAAHSSDGRFY